MGRELAKGVTGNRERELTGLSTRRHRKVEPRGIIASYAPHAPHSRHLTPAGCRKADQLPAHHPLDECVAMHAFQGNKGPNIRRLQAPRVF